MSFQVLKLKAYACLAITPNSRQLKKKMAGMHSLALPNWLTSSLFDWLVREEVSLADLCERKILF